LIQNIKPNLAKIEKERQKMIFELVSGSIPTRFLDGSLDDAMCALEEEEALEFTSW
jgi:hypothetical protein